MKAVAVYVRLYLECLQKALRGIAKSPWTLLLPGGLGVVWTLLQPLVAPLGIVGGFILGFVEAALFSCYLYFTGEVVSNAKVRLGELRRSIGVYFWSVINVLFVVFVARYLLSMVLAQNPRGGTLLTVLNLIALVALNAVPETLYLRATYGGMATIQRSVKFLQDNWIEWFIPNLLVAAALYWVVARVMGVLPMASVLLSVFLFGALFHLLMVFRGHLYQALDGSSHRQRMFRYRNAP